MKSPSPPYTHPARIDHDLRELGYAIVHPDDLCTLAGLRHADLDALLPSWQHLEADAFLKDGGRYRHRRHACFIQRGAELALQPHRPHWQSVEYNALHGGMQRLFAPVEPATLALPAWPRLLTALGNTVSRLRGEQPWYIEAHQFRIDTRDGIGRPTPEGAHRDGVDLVAVLLVGRHHIKGGETRVFAADGPAGQRFTMLEPWTLLLLDDSRVIHESTPIQATGPDGYRDTLVLTYRAGGFQGPA
ncbi:2OG-Fe dioxygenase family protein [Massilia sp. TS11]|uniref:2OG-Fe dioxygenase family protein n=1 Tax=Massilia sp. TS11 TaxID=2908003 RepID=UPI001EDBA478|nr:2OG-Fe dioxygenase family protein [Massilia sp. TS11]MCG2583684.1 2OG-Fe dioxygenase family protein [Massilia sp. TS11]